MDTAHMLNRDNAANLNFYQNQYLSGSNNEDLEEERKSLPDADEDQDELDDHVNEMSFNADNHQLEEDGESEEEGQSRYDLQQYQVGNKSETN